MFDFLDDVLDDFQRVEPSREAIAKTQVLVMQLDMLNQLVEQIESRNPGYSALVGGRLCGYVVKIGDDQNECRRIARSIHAAGMSVLIIGNPHG
ncbi:MAG: hypothetical protein KDA60_16030 [Planctomycetales bacterium]|nr:hypothetical protein [Planctomycetales bacterium]